MKNIIFFLYFYFLVLIKINICSIHLIELNKNDIEYCLNIFFNDNDDIEIIKKKELFIHFLNNSLQDFIILLKKIIFNIENKNYRTLQKKNYEKIIEISYFMINELESKFELINHIKKNNGFLVDDNRELIKIFFYIFQNIFFVEFFLENNFSFKNNHVVKYIDRRIKKFIYELNRNNGSDCIEDIQNIFNNLNEVEKKLRLSSIQNLYISLHDYIYYSKDVLAIGMKYVIQNINGFFSIFCGYDVYRYMRTIKRDDSIFTGPCINCFNIFQNTSQIDNTMGILKNYEKINNFNNECKEIEKIKDNNFLYNDETVLKLSICKSYEKRLKLFNEEYSNDEQLKDCYKYLTSDLILNRDYLIEQYFTKERVDKAIERYKDYQKILNEYIYDIEQCNYNSKIQNLSYSYVKKNSFFRYGIPFLVSFLIFKYIKYGISKGYFDSIKKIINSIHNYFMGEKYKKAEDDLLNEIVNYDADVKTNLKDSSFDIFRKKGLLNWFDAVINNIENIYKRKNAKVPKELDKIIMINGESGNGKTHLIRSLHFTLKEIAKQYNEDSKIEFYPIEAKHFHGPVIDRWKCPIDMLHELEMKLDDIKFTKKIIIIHFDEFHLYFYNEFGSLSQSRIADFLKFFSLVKEKQDEDCAGALFVILTTNKEEFIPYEMYTNPSRINTIITLPNPSYYERIIIMKKFLELKCINIQNINFEYISSLLEEYQLSNGNILYLLKYAIIQSKINKTIINTDLLYQIINEKVRNIINNEYEKEDCSAFQKSLSLFYSSMASVAYYFNNYTFGEYLFDAVTIYPIKKEKGSWSNQNLYIKNNFNEIEKRGDIFCINKNSAIMSKKKLIANIIKNLIGIVFLVADEDQILKEFNIYYDQLYDNLYTYFLLHDGIEVSTIKQKNMNIEYKNKGYIISPQFNNLYAADSINIKINALMPNMKKYILEFLQNSSIKKIINIVNDMLLDKKIITKKNISDNNDLIVLFEENIEHFIKLTTSLENLMI